MKFDVNQLFAYSPMLILIGMGCVVLLAETFARGRSRAGLAWLGVAGCVAALAAVVAEWGDAAARGHAFPGHADRRSDGAVPRRRVHRRRAADAAVAPRLPARARVRVRRVLRAGAVRHRRHGDGRPRDAPGVAADRHRDHVAGRLRADRLLAEEPAQLRGGDEVLPHGGVRHRLPGLRHRAGLRDHGRRAVVRRHRRTRSAAPAARRSSTWANTSSWWRWRSRWRRCPSTCGRPTRTKARRRR